MKTKGTTLRKQLVSTMILVALLAAPGLAAAETYDVDPIHSAVMFRAKRGVVYVYGRFNQFSGTLEMQGDDVASGKLTLEVKTPSIDTNNQQRDDHLRSADFLDVANHSTMRFESTGVRAVGEGAYEVTGNLTLRGVTKPVTATVEHVGSGTDPRTQKKVTGFDATFSLKRTDFGVSALVGPVSDEIDVQIALHAVAR